MKRPHVSVDGLSRSIEFRGTLFATGPRRLSWEIFLKTGESPGYGECADPGPVDVASSGRRAIDTVQDVFRAPNADLLVGAARHSTKVMAHA